MTNKDFKITVQNDKLTCPICEDEKCHWDCGETHEFADEYGACTKCAGFDGEPCEPPKGEGKKLWEKEAYMEQEQLAHICRFNDGSCVCDCFVEGMEAMKQYIEHQAATIEKQRKALSILTQSDLYAFAEEALEPIPFPL